MIGWVAMAICINLKEKKYIFTKVSHLAPLQIKTKCHFLLELIFPPNFCKFWLWL